MTIETILSIFLGAGVAASVGFRVFLPILAIILVIFIFYIVFKLYKKIEPEKSKPS